MAAKTPIRTIFTDGVATGLAEFQTGEFIDYQLGGTGVTALGTAGQVLKVNSGATALEWGGVEAILNIEGLPDGTGITVTGTDKLALSDGGTEKQVNISQLGTIFAGDTQTLTNKTISGASNTLSNIANSSLTNSAVTVGSTSISLGGSSTTLTGITNLTAGGINITGNSITSADSTIIEMGEGLSVTGNLTVSGDMTVSGTTTSLSTTNTAVTDNLLELNSGVGSNSDDSGIIIERGSTGDNAIMFWDETEDKFAFGTTTATADSNGNLTTSDADLRVGDISATTYSGAGIKDEDNMASDSATHLATQQSIKKYVDDSILTKDNTDEIAEGSNLYFTNARADARITNALIDEDNMATDSATRLPSQQSVKAYVDSQILTKDNTDEITEGSTNLYYTDARADARIANNIIDEDAMGTDSATRAPSQQSVKAFVASQILTKDNTDEITEGSNLYFTNARADARITNALKDEDDLVSNSATHLASQQSIKAYVDAQTTDEVRQDIIGAMLTGNTETLITVTYQDSDGTVDFVVDNDLANYDNSTSSFITGLSTTTLTNKTFDVDGTGNSLSNIANANIKAGAALDATKIADGSISNTEYQYLNGVSSNVQTQLNAKATSSQSIAFALALG